jgi:signal peptidase I
VVTTEKNGTPQRLSTARYTFYLSIVGCAVVLIYLFAGREMRFFLVPSTSMIPSLLPGDYIVTLSEGEYSRGDVVVLSDPHKESGYLVKRVVAVGGDTAEVAYGAFLLNGVYASEPYVNEPMKYTMGPVEVPPGEVLVLGDNRNHSDDSSTWAPLEQSQPLDAIIGKVRFIYLPFSRVKPVWSYPLRNAVGD